MFPGGDEKEAPRIDNRAKKKNGMRAMIREPRKYSSTVKQGRRRKVQRERGGFTGRGKNN